MVVALATFLATILSPPDASNLSHLSIPVLVAYNLYALSAVLLFQFKREAAARLGSLVQGVDLFWAVAVTSVTGGASSHYSPPLYVFALLAAAFRWGLSETLVSGAIATILLVLQAGAAVVGWIGIPLRVGDFVMRSTWIILVAIVLGYLAERDKRLRAESELLARISRQMRTEAGLRASVRAVIAELARALEAEASILVMTEAPSGRCILWRGDEATPAGAGDSDRAAADQSDCEAWLFPVPDDVDAWSAVARRPYEPQHEPGIRAVDVTGSRISATFQIPESFPGFSPWRSLVCLPALSIDDWAGRLIIVNPARPVREDQQLRFLQTAWSQVRPALVNIDLLRRLGSRLDELNAARLEAITEKKRLEAVMDVLPTGLAIIDAEGGNIASNAVFEQVWGQGRPVTRGVSDYVAYKAWWLDGGRPVQPEEWASARAVRFGETVTGQVMEIERFSGERAYVLNSAAPIVDPDGKINGCVVVIQDITRRVSVEQALARNEAALKRSNEQLVAANDALRRLNETLESRVAERTAELARRTTQLRALAGDLTRAEEQERQRVAQVIHDHLQQILAVARMKLGMALGESSGGPHKETLTDVDGLIAESLEIARSLTADLSPAILHRSGLGAALQWLGRWYGDRYALEVVVEADGNPPLAEEVRATLFRAVRELLFNVVKHAHVRSARVRLERNGDAHVRIVVSDDGAGFDPDAVRAREGTAGSFGLFSLRERLELLGGHLEVNSTPGRGSSIAVSAPLSGAQRNTRT